MEAKTTIVRLVKIHYTIYHLIILVLMIVDVNYIKILKHRLVQDVIVNVNAVLKDQTITNVHIAQKEHIFLMENVDHVLEVITLTLPQENVTPVIVLV